MIPTQADVQLTEVDYDPFATPELARAVPTTDAQREVWLADQLGEQASLAFNESISLEIAGALRVQEFQDSLLALTDRHESLRSTFSSDGMNMLIAPRGALQAEIVDLCALTPAEREQAVAAQRAAAVTHPFNLVDGPLVRATLLRLAPDRHEFVLSAHHIVCDGWSFAVIARDLMRIYASLSDGSGTSALPQADSFGDYALGEHDPAFVAQVGADEHYWVSLFDRGVPTLDLPTDRPRGSVRGFSSHREDLRIEPALVDAARKLGAASGASLFATLFGLFGALMSRLGADESGDVVVGVPSAGQAARDATQLVGHCVNLLPVRLAVDPGQPVEALLRRASGAVLDAYDHQACTFGRLLSKLAITRDASRLPLVSVQFNIDSPIDPADLAAPGLAVSLRSNPRAFENFELFVNATQIEGAVVLECQYNTELFDAETVRRWLQLYRALVERAVADPRRPVSELFGATHEDLERLAACNATVADYPADRRVEQLFAAQAARTPDAIAVVSGGQRVSYRELAQRADAVAAALAEQGLGAGNLVGMACGRNVHMLASMLGILQTGAAYVPLDPGFPAERLAHMCEDAELAWVVTDRSVSLPALGAARLLQADELAPRAFAAREAGDVEAPAYVIYTSGSTGKPKGVAVPHRAVSNFLASMAREPGLRADDRLVAVTTTSFDIAVLELFLPLTVGAQVILADRETVLDGQRLRALIEQHQATVLQATPSGWRVLIEAGWAGHAGFKALVGGEALGEDLAAQLVARTGETWNMYGPTETTVWSTCWRVPGQRQGIRIGTPIANTQIHVLDERLQTCSIGVPGEIYIGGDGVAIGYLHREALTAERFIADPSAPGQRIYRTGDRGRWRNDGTLEHMGRLDFQVKVRGYRIELGEIESCLARHPGVEQAVVVLREDDPGDLRLVGYAVPRAGEIEVAEVREFLRRSLPDYMVPSHIVALPTIPLLPNGKIHRKALPKPNVDAAPRAKAAAPTTPTEAAVLETMERVLNLRGLGIDDDFFALGGHSLLASRLTATLNKTFTLSLPLRTVFESATARRLAHAIESGRGAAAPAAPALVRVADQTQAPLTVMQERIRFMEEMHPGRVVYNTPSAHRLTGPLDRPALEQALRSMVQRQPALRSCVVKGPDGALLKVLADVPLDLPFADLSALPRADRDADLMRRLQAIIDQPMALDRAPLFRVALFRMDETEHVLLFMVHHIVWDGWSFDLFYREMSAAYAAALRGEASALPLPAVSYVDFAHWHKAWMASDACRAQVGFWRERYAAIESPKALPTDRPRGPGMTGVGAVEWVHVDKELTERLRGVAQAGGTTLNMLILGVYAAMMSEAVQGRSIVVGVPVRGRGQLETESVMGFFNNLLPLHFDVHASTPLSAWFAKVKRDLLDAFAHQDVPFERLASEPELARHAGKAGLYQTLFSFQDARERERHWGPLSHSSVLVMQKGATEDFSLWLMEVPAGLEGGFNFNADLFDAGTVRMFRDRLIGLLQRTARHPELPLGELLGLPGADRDAFMAWLNTRAEAVPTVASVSVRAAVLSAGQARLAGIWSELLGIPATDIHPADNFFDLGGSSLLAMRAIELTRARLQLSIEPRRYAVETLAQLAPADSGQVSGPVAEVARLWADLLGIDASSIRPEDNFFDLGGSSLLAMRFVDVAQRELALVVEPQRLVSSSLAQVAEAAVPVDQELAAAEAAAASAAQPQGLLSRVLRRAGWPTRAR